MARLLEISMRFSPPLLRAVLWAGLGLALAGPMRSQSSGPDPQQADGSTKATEDSRGSQQPVAGDAKAEQSVPKSPEEIRQATIEADTKRLFRLSAELRAEVAKTYKDSLSLTVLKKAEEIEKLAKSLKALMDGDAATASHEDR